MKKFFVLLAVVGLALAGCATQGLVGPNTSGHLTITQQLSNGAVAIAEGSFPGNTSDTETVTIGADVYEFDSGGGVTGGRITVTIGVGAEATLDNLITAINANGTELVRADKSGTDTLLLQSAATRGGTAAAADPSIALTEAAVNFNWTPGNVNMNTLGGEASAAKKRSVCKVTLTTDMLAGSAFRPCQFDFTPTRFTVYLQSSAGVPKLNFSDQVTISGNAILWTDAGAVHPANTDILTIEAWE